MMKTVRTILGAIILTTGLGCGGGSGSQGEVEKTSSSSEFPIIMINLNPTSLPEVADRIDVAAYYTTFAPYEDSIQAFRGPYAKEMIDAARANGVRVAVTIPVLAHPNVADRDMTDAQVQELLGDGIRMPVLDEDGELEKYELYDSTGTVRIPVRKDEITSAFIEHVAAKAGEFIAHIRAYDSDRTVAYWYGIEEIRYWSPPEYQLQRKLRELVDLHDQPNTRALIAYLPNHYEPDVSLPLSLLQGEADDGTLNGPLGGLPVGDPSPLYLWRENGNLRPLTSHLMVGNYVDMVLGKRAQESRIWSFEQIQRLKKAAENIKNIYAANGEKAPENRVFHMPLIRPGAVILPGHARHDFWVGVHEARGIFLYNYAVAHVNGEPTVAWQSYSEGLALIKKGGMRIFLTQGTRTVPEFSASRNRGLNVTLWRRGDDAYLIVTHSYARDIDFSIQLGDGVSDIKMIVGESGSSIPSTDSLSGSFSGIDARVYRVRFSN